MSRRGWQQVYELSTLASGASLIVCALSTSPAPVVPPTATAAITVSEPTGATFAAGSIIPVAWSTSGAASGVLRMVAVDASYGELGVIATGLPLSGRYDSLVAPAAWVGPSRRICLTAPTFSACSRQFDIVAAPVVPTTAVNLLVNGEFGDASDVLVPASVDGYRGWGCWMNDSDVGAMACNLRVADGATVLRAAPARAIPEPWRAQLSQGVTLRDGGRYVLRIRARASSPVVVPVVVEHGWMTVSHGLGTTMSVGTAFTDAEWSFTATTAGQPSKVALHLGGLAVGTTLEVDRVVLEAR